MKIRTRCTHQVYDGHVTASGNWCRGGTEYELSTDFVFMEQAASFVDQHNETVGRYLHEVAETFKLMRAL